MAFNASSEMQAARSHQRWAKPNARIITKTRRARVQNAAPFEHARGGPSRRRATPSLEACGIIVLIGAAFSIFASYVFNIQSLFVQALMTTPLTSMIAFGVLYRGHGS
jgi:hypothetical protein